MASRPPGNTPPAKPWERVGTSSGPAPFKPPSSGSTSDVVKASGTAKPGEIVSNPERNVSPNTNILGRPVLPRPWQQNYGNRYVGGYGSSMNYNTGYGSGTYGAYGGNGGSYGNGLYGSNMTIGYGGSYGSPGMYGGSMYNNGFGGPMGGYGTGSGGPYGDQDPNNPYGPTSPPGFWISLIRVMHGLVNFCGRVATLIDQNTQAFHLFMSALLQLFDRSGLLYGELARFVFRLLGIRTMPRKLDLPGSNVQGRRCIEAPKGNGSSWDSVWADDSKA
ncbi:peroxisomal membrane protein 13-like isoform X1 [Typha angustifolia]|uniref:peroxisomal membrane protein 13-like isoform X1 n=1 Tax=Typha angustifolia TaxID=59011 RepID=UPI003C2BF94D